MKYHFKVRKEKKGYSAQCLEMPGCVTQAETMKELKANMREVVELMLYEPAESKSIAPMPDMSIKVGKSIHLVAPDPQTALAHMVRYYRIKHKMTQKQIAEKMGFSDIYSYQRLETPKCNPTLKTILRIKEILPEISIDLVAA